MRSIRSSAPWRPRRWRRSLTRAGELGIAVNIWTVDDEPEIVRLAAAGVDAIITDVPDVARRALGRA